MSQPGHFIGRMKNVNIYEAFLLGQAISPGKVLQYPTGGVAG